MTARVSKRLGLLVAAGLVSAALAAALWRSRWPAYGGKPLPFWFKQLPILSVNEPSARITYQLPVYKGSLGVPGPSVRDYRKAVSAIRAIGTNSLPFLIHKLERHPIRSRPAKLAQRYAGNLPLIGEFFPSERRMAIEQAQAVAGLIALCPLPPDTVLKLQTLSLDFKGETWSMAGDVLRANDDPGVLRDALSLYE